MLIDLVTVIPFEKISFTGGEPLLNTRLEDLLEALYLRVPRLELNTNGTLLSSARWRRMSPFLQQIKISLDTLDQEEFKAITGFQAHGGAGRVVEAIRLVQSSDVELVVNAVVMRRTLPALPKLIDLVRKHKLRLHLLDFTYTEACRQVWEDQFVPNEEVMEFLEQSYGRRGWVPRFGAAYWEFRAPEGAVIRVRGSLSDTMRAGRCDACKHFCQSGIFGLRMSTHGWVTYCYSTYEEDGVLLRPGMTTDEIARTVRPLLSDIASARPRTDSLQEMVTRLDLKPVNILSRGPA